MLAWLSASAEPAELQSQPAPDLVTSRDEPDTPVPVFAMRAFKQALFGTPQLRTPAPPARSAQTENHAATKDDGQISRGRRPEASNKEALEKHSDGDKILQVSRSPSPSKPLGILVTPGTVNGRRKQVKFGEQVLDNGDKRSKYSKSGLPDSCPGKFPSPFTPKTIPSSRTRQSVATAVPNRGVVAVKSSFKEVSDVSAPSNEQQAQTSQSVRSKDDSDVTGDLTLPQSASGRYWKAQYDQYSTNSVAETKRLIAKNKLAKDYARLKDDEAAALRSQLEFERKKRGRREGSLELQIKQLRERLRNALADNAKMTAEVSAMRVQLEKHSLGQSTSIESPPAMPTLHKIAAIAPKPVAMSDSVDVWLDQDDSVAKHKARRLRRSPKNEQLKPKEPENALVQVAGTKIAAKRSPLRPAPRNHAIPKAKALSPRNPNITPSRPRVDKLSEDAAASPDARVAPAVFDAVMKVAESKTTRSTRSPGSARAKTKYVYIEGQRLDDAKARVAERRRIKKNSRTNVCS